MEYTEQLTDWTTRVRRARWALKYALHYKRAGDLARACDNLDIAAQHVHAAQRIAEQ